MDSNRAQDVVLSRIKIGRAKPMDLANMLAALSTSTSTKIFADCDVVIEAVTEDESLKKIVYQSLTEVLRDDAILASNTSTISITRMAQYTRHPERFIGMHFFNPVDRMELVEVIRGEKTDDETVATIVALARKIRKTPIVVRDCAGFLVNRILLPYMNESLILLQDGASMDAIDRAATRFGMPMGPLALTDMVGLQTAVFAGKVLADAYPDRTASSPILVEMLKASPADKKTVLKFWSSAGKKARPQPEPGRGLDRGQVPDRRTRDGRGGDHRSPLPAHVARGDPRAGRGNRPRAGGCRYGLDLGDRVLSLQGWNPGWCDTQGASAIVDRLARYAPLGKRFEPTETLVQQARTGESFYPRPKVASSSK